MFMYNEYFEGLPFLSSKDLSTRLSDQGVIPIDNTLIDRDGMLIPDAGWFWDHAEERNKIAQDYIFANHVCTSGKHDPLEFRLFRKQEVCEALNEPFRNHTALRCELIDWVCDRDIPGDFAMDSNFTCAEILNHIHREQDRLGRPRGYVGDHKSNRKLEWKERITKANDLAVSIPASDRKEMVEFRARCQLQETSRSVSNTRWLVGEHCAHCDTCAIILRNIVGLSC
jgi:hypothetical protein